MVTFSAVQLEDLPVVVKFILHSLSTSDAYEVISLQHCDKHKIKFYFQLWPFLYFELMFCPCVGSV